MPSAPLPGSRSSVIDWSSGGGSSLDAQGRNLRWIDDFGDELAVSIALRNWTDAVVLVEKGEFALDPI